jgi:acetylornithine deacetylase/succinyl-diaminopimelate desuccinylase-like protein
MMTVSDSERYLFEAVRNGAAGYLTAAITPTGVDVPSVAQASNTLLSEITTKLSCRLAPGQDPDRALETLRDHLLTNAPWGAEVEVQLGERNAAWVMEPHGPAWEAAAAAVLRKSRRMTDEDDDSLEASASGGA